MQNRIDSIITLLQKCDSTTLEAVELTLCRLTSEKDSSFKKVLSHMTGLFGGDGAWKSADLP